MAAPEDALLLFKQAYEQKSVPAFADLVSDDYRFHSSAMVMSRFAEGFSRDFELRSLGGMFNGVKRPDGSEMPAADSIAIHYGEVMNSEDPEHADSLDHYRVLCVSSFQMDAVLASERIIHTDPGLHVFHMVRGDAAVLAPGQTGDADRWYIRRWLENLDGVNAALAGMQGGCGESFVAGSPAAPKARLLGIRALTHPACARLELMLDLPGTEPVQVQVLDVTGRVRNTREIAVARAGEHKIDAGEGASLTPGVYWVRVRQGDRKPSTRMVVVAK